MSPMAIGPNNARRNPKLLLTTVSTCWGVAVPSSTIANAFLVQRELESVGDEAGGVGDRWWILPIRADDAFGGVDRLDGGVAAGDQLHARYEGGRVHPVHAEEARRADL